MGGSCSTICRESDVEETPGPIDLFASDDKSENSETTTTVATEENLSKTDTFHLDDEYTFAELEKEVFQIGSDCITDDPAAGAISGRISNVYEWKNCFNQLNLSVTFLSIKSNGKVFFRSQNTVNIGYYKGKKKLSELGIRPVLWTERNKLQQRGRVFAKYGLQAHYAMYTDKMLVRGCMGTSQISAEGRIMVDTSSFLHFNPNYYLGSSRRYHGEGDGGDEEDYRQMMRSSSDGRMCSTTIPEGSLHLCWPTLCGFSLKAKRWGEIVVQHLQEIQFKEDAFDKLVLEDSGLKTMIRGLVQNIHQDQQFTDIIQGKGGGCSFLLQGPPGVGKTLTAEAVSESLHRPLYCIDVGELGTTPDMLEERLKKILEVAERWNAVVLIDECDIFLAKRNNQDIHRNAMVGIFLRLLEYYNGILFLTSNRANDMDEAFQSRISITLEYTTLNLETRTMIWSNLLDAAGIDEEMIGLDIRPLLAEHNLNGRQIKTAIRLAMSLAKTANEPISHKHFLQTIQYANCGGEAATVTVDKQGSLNRD